MDELQAKLVLDVVLDRLVTVKEDDKEEEEEEDGVEEEGGTFPRRDGGIIAAVSSFGTSFWRTFSAMRYMASANCSAFSLPVFSMSHKFLNQ